MTQPKHRRRAPVFAAARFLLAHLLGRYPAGAWLTLLASLSGLLIGGALLVAGRKDVFCAATARYCAELSSPSSALPPPQPDQATPGPDGACKRGTPRDGGCWVYISERPPCPPPYRESEGKCWGVILEKRAPFPSSVEPPIRLTIDGPP